MCTIRAITAVLLLLACSAPAAKRGAEPRPNANQPPGASAVAPTANTLDAERTRMIEEQLKSRDIKDPRVLDAMARVPRHELVADEYRAEAYADTPLPIGAGQTISQPYIVALMSQLAEIKPGDRVLEIGTGSGYQAAVLSTMGAEVYSIEIIKALAETAAESLKRLGYANIHVRHGDGYAGWPEAAPFKAILLTAAPPRIPVPLQEQLAIGGKLVAPVGDAAQDLIVITRTAEGYETRNVLPVRFVPMTGRAQAQN
jgi:protein-L-isoaspartate(D-aspartate) O-methyltransferase